MRVLLLGAGGMLACDLVATAPTGVALESLAVQECDITDYAGVAAIVASTHPDVVLNAAAYTAVDQAEAEPDLVMSVNRHGPGNIGRGVMAAGGRALVVHFSTDYVFGGSGTRPYREDDATAPLGVYAASKLAGEQSLRASGAPHTVIRTSWLFGAHGRSFPRTMWERAKAGKPTKVVNDQRGRPTFTVDLAANVWRLVARAASGGAALPHVLHVANRGEATWYDVAGRVFSRMGVPALLAACTTAEYPTPAKRPAYSVLDTGRADALIGPLPPWEDALDRFLDRLA